MKPVAQYHQETVTRPMVQETIVHQEPVRTTTVQEHRVTAPVQNTVVTQHQSYQPPVVQSTTTTNTGAVFGNRYQPMSSARNTTMKFNY